MDFTFSRGTFFFRLPGRIIKDHGETMDNFFFFSSVKNNLRRNDKNNVPISQSRKSSDRMIVFILDDNMTLVSFKMRPHLFSSPSIGDSNVS